MEKNKNNNKPFYSLAYEVSMLNARLRAKKSRENKKKQKEQKNNEKTN